MLPLLKDSSQNKIPTKILFLVICFSLSNYFDPLLSYYIPYLVQIKGVSTFQVTNKILPIQSYGTLGFMLLAGPVCEYVPYKAVIIFGCFANLLRLLLLYFGNTILLLQTAELIESRGTASYLVFQAYIFFLVTENHFQEVTSFNQASVSTAYFLAAELGQILISFGSSYNVLIYITMAAAALTFIASLLLPGKGLHKNRTQGFMLNLFSQDQGFWSIVQETWSDKRLQLLSIWWVSVVSVFTLGLNYGTTRFAAIGSFSEYNGQVSAAAAAFGALVSLSSICLARSVMRLGGFFYILGSLMFGALCLGLANSRTLWLAYVIYIFMLGVEKLLICSLYAHCGSLLRNNEYVLMFSFNTALAQATRVIIQALIEIAGLDIAGHYNALGYYFMGVAILFSMLYGLYVWKMHTWEIVSPVNLGLASVCAPLMKQDIPGGEVLA